MLQLEDTTVHKELELVHYSIEQHEPLATFPRPSVYLILMKSIISNQLFLCHEDADAAETAQDPVLEEGELPTGLEMSTEIIQR